MLPSKKLDFESSSLTAPIATTDAHAASTAKDAEPSPESVLRSPIRDLIMFVQRKDKRKRPHDEWPVEYSRSHLITALIVQWRNLVKPSHTSTLSRYLGLLAGHVGRLDVLRG